MSGLFDRIAGGIQGKSAMVLDRLPDFLMAPATRSGVTVTYATALQVTAVLACTRVIGEGLAQAPCKVLRRRENGRGADVARTQPLNRLLSLCPMDGQTAFEFIETAAMHMALVGNAYAFVNRAGGAIVEIVLLDPTKVKVIRRNDLSLHYEVTGEDGVTRMMPSGTIWHMRGISWNGFTGLETVRLAREAVGLSIALEESHARQHRDGIKASGAYSVEGNLSAEQHAQLTLWLKEAASGANVGAPLILDRGAKWLSQEMTGVDQQHLETRRFQIEEICRAMRVIPLMVGLSEKTATYASVEQMFLQHAVHGLAPWATRMEQSAMINLLTRKEQEEGYFIKFNLSALMRGDYKSRQEGLQIQRRNGVINADEWRDLEDMNPRGDAGGAQYIVEGNMAVQDGRDLVQMNSAKTGG